MKWNGLPVSSSTLHDRIDRSVSYAGEVTPPPKPPGAASNAGAPPPRRADAERNRQRIVDAARALYAADGLGVSMAAVAREAAVGKATLSRHFASQQELIDAVFVDRMRAYVAAAEDGLRAGDPWEGFVGYVTAVCEMQAGDRGFADLLTLTFPTAQGVETLREQAYRGFVRIIDRSQRAGQLRQDFVAEDMVVLLMANAGVVSATARDAPESWRRLIGHLLRGYATDQARLPPLPHPPTFDQLATAMDRAVARQRSSPRGIDRDHTGR